MQALKTFDEQLIDSVLSRYGEGYENFSDSLCSVAIAKAKSLVEQNRLRYYQFRTATDSSETPTVILMEDLKFKILGEYHLKEEYRDCFNEAMTAYYELTNGINPIKYAENKYDSLDQLGLTHKQPRLEGGGLPTALYEYIYCNLDLSKEEPPYSKVYIEFNISKEGNLEELKILKSEGHSLDSDVINLLRQTQGKWTPRRDTGGENAWSGHSYWFEYNPIQTEEYCIQQ